MATGNFLTNKGKQWLMQGKWEPGSGATIGVLLLQGTQPVTMNTPALVADLNFVSDLLASTATECNFTNYGARKTLTRIGATENDVSDWSALDASDLVWASAGGGAGNNTIIGAAFYDAAGGSDATRALISVDWFALPITTNGGDYTYAINDLYHAV
jgi:hypothetical protein